LTAFIIQVSSLFQPSAGDSTNKIFIAIYNHTMNASSPIDLQQYLSWDAKFTSTVSSSVFLLYISLAVSVSEAAFALFISVWLSRHQRSLTETGPTIHERITKRHETYRGLMEWRMPILIEILPTVGLVALLFFAAFIRLFHVLSMNDIHNSLFSDLVDPFGMHIQPLENSSITSLS
jgi:hypothetical protein